MRRQEYAGRVVALPLRLLSSVTWNRRSSVAWHLKISAFIYVVDKPFAGLILEYSDIHLFRNVDPLQCRVYYIVGMGKRVASALVLCRDTFNITSHECLLVLCARRGKPCLQAEAGEELGWELLPHLFFWSVGREYDGKPSRSCTAPCESVKCLLSSRSRKKFQTAGLVFSNSSMRMTPDSLASIFRVSSPSSLPM